MKQKKAAFADEDRSSRRLPRNQRFPEPQTISLPVYRERLRSLPKQKIEVTEARLKKYIKLTETALKKAKLHSKVSKNDRKRFAHFKDFCERYLSDAKHFMQKGDYVTAFAALNYAHAWMDAAAIAGWVTVKDKNRHKFIAMD